MEVYKEAAQFLSSKQYDDENVVDYFKRVFPVLTTKGEDSKKELSKSAKLAVDVLDTQPGADKSPGSWQNAFNAVTYLTNHEIGRSNDNRMVSNWYGANRKLNAKALETAVEFAEAA